MSQFWTVELDPENNPRDVYQSPEGMRGCWFFTGKNLVAYSVLAENKSDAVEKARAARMKHHEGVKKSLVGWFRGV